MSPEEQLASRSVAELMSLRGKAAVITGGGRGIGEAIARRLAEAGADLAIGDLNEQSAKETAEEMQRRFGVKTVAARLDVADSSSVASLAALAEQTYGRLDIWVNNAGVFPPAVLIETTDEQWDQVHDINLRGTFFGCREAGRRMAKAGHGVIINITSVSGYRGRASVGHYAAAKHGVAGLTKSLAVELGPKGVRVVAVSPCMTETPGLDEQRKVSRQGDAKGNAFQEMQARIRSAIPLNRFGHPDDVARAVLFCASDLASFVTASTVFADGGCQRDLALRPKSIDLGCLLLEREKEGLRSLRQRFVGRLDHDQIESKGRIDKGTRTELFGIPRRGHEDAGQDRHPVASGYKVQRREHRIHLDEALNLNSIRCKISIKRTPPRVLRAGCDDLEGAARRKPDPLRDACAQHSGQRQKPRAYARTAGWQGRASLGAPARWQIRADRRGPAV
jgi:NAD(P)-dependent dehydrogenase (short-subunit alcohol dehydrogenase family)